MAAVQTNPIAWETLLDLSAHDGPRHVRLELAVQGCRRHRPPALRRRPSPEPAARGVAGRLPLGGHRGVRAAHRRGDPRGEDRVGHPCRGARRRLGRTPGARTRRGGAAATALRPRTGRSRPAARAARAVAASDDRGAGRDPRRRAVPARRRRAGGAGRRWPPTCRAHASRGRMPMPSSSRTAPPTACGGWPARCASWGTPRSSSRTRRGTACARWPRRRASPSVPVRVDAHGVDVDALVAASVRTGARAALVTPAHQFPVGVALSAERRDRLIAWARGCDGVVIEDDYDAEFRYDRRPIGALQAMAPDRVVLAGSLSKTATPALGLGWLVLPPWLRGRRARRGGRGAVDDRPARTHALPRRGRPRPPPAGRPHALSAAARGAARSARTRAARVPRVGHRRGTPRRAGPPSRASARPTSCASARPATSASPTSAAIASRPTRPRPSGSCSATATSPIRSSTRR